MICVLLFALIGQLVAQMHDVQLFQLAINEGKEHFKEYVTTNAKECTEVIRTPKHCDREGVTQMIDCRYRLVADKVEGEKFCVITPYKPEEDGNPAEFEQAYEEAKQKMPKDIVEIQNRILTVAFKGKLPKRIQKFCGARTVVRGIVDNQDMKEIEKEAVKLALESKKDSRKRAILKEFTACTNASTMKIMTCPGDKLRAECKIRRSSCTYKISCPMDLANGGFNCQGLHKFNSMICCDYNC